MYEYKAKILSVYDGDGSFDAIIDLGMKITMERKIRLAGVDTPEMRGEQKIAGKIVRDFVRSLILNKEVTIKTHKDESGKYGRLLADIEIEPISIHTVSDLGRLLVLMGHAKPYDGGKKELWTKEELDEIINKRIN